MCDALGTDGVRVTDGMAVSEPACAASGRSVARSSRTAALAGIRERAARLPGRLCATASMQSGSRPTKTRVPRGVRTVAPDDRQRRIPPGGSPRKNSKTSPKAAKPGLEGEPVVLDARMAAISGPWAEDSAGECEEAGPSQPE